MAGAPHRFPRERDEARYNYVRVADLRYDPQNPRLGGAAKRKNQEQIQKYLEGHPHYALDLVGSILENGFLPYEPLIVRQENGTFVVIEGNRRLAAVRSILSGPPNKYGPDAIAGLQRIPVLVFAEGADHRDSEDVLRYLGVKHLFGFRDWPPTSKAMFLDERVKSKRGLDQVLRELNITRQEVARYLVPYRLRKAASLIFNKVNAEDFWSLAESFSRTRIRAYIELDVDRRTMQVKFFNRAKLRHLTQFLYGRQRRVTDTRQLSALGKALGSPQAARALERGATLEEASLYVAPKQETIAQLLRQLDRLFDKIKTLSPEKEDREKILEAMQEFSRKLKK
jgi:uncharacterized coiled-coil protein SlyX